MEWKTCRFEQLRRLNTVSIYKSQQKVVSWLVGSFLNWSAMKIFQTIEKNLESGGFIRNQRPFNPTQTEHIVKIMLFMAMLFIYLGLEAKTPRQYMDSILMSTVGTLCTIAYISQIFKYANLFELIDDTEQLVNESESVWNFSITL